MHGDVPELGTADLLHSLLQRGQGSHLTFDDLLDGFEQRAFGVLLLLASLPTLVPGVAAVSGPVIALAGAQMLFGLERPWLPHWIRRRKLERGMLTRVLARLERGLRKLEKLCRPRWHNLWQRGALRVVGLLLVLLGVALALPIPFTNYVIAAPVVVLAFGLTEYDGKVLSLGSLLGVVALVVVGVVYGALLMELLQWLLP